MLNHWRLTDERFLLLIRLSTEVMGSGDADAVPVPVETTVRSHANDQAVVNSDDMHFLEQDSAASKSDSRAEQRHYAIEQDFEKTQEHVGCIRHAINEYRSGEHCISQPVFTQRKTKRSLLRVFAGVIDLYVLRARDLALGTFATAPLTLDWIYVRFPAGYSTAHRPFPQWAAPNLPYLYEIALALQIVSSPLLVSTYIAEIFHLALSAASSCAQFSCVSV